MNLNASIDFNIKHFFHWWLHELSYFVPETIRQKLSDRSGNVFLYASEQGLKLLRFEGDTQHLLAELDFNENGEDQFQQLLEKEPELGKARYILRLQTHQALKKILYLPLAAKENLMQVMTFEMNRFTPFTPEQVYFDAKILSREESGYIKVLLVVSPKAILDKLYLRLLEVKIFPDVVDFEEVPNNYEEDLEIYNLLPDWERPEKNKLARLMTWALSVTLVLLAVAVFVFPVSHEKKNVEMLRTQLDALERDAMMVQKRQAEMESIIQQTERLIEFKNKAPLVTELMNNLSQLFNDETWISHLQYLNGQVQIQGQSPTASALIGVLEASPFFSNVRFVSPLTQDKRTGLERFQISANVDSVRGSNEQ